MRLELVSYEVAALEEGTHTGYEGGALTVNPKELAAELFDPEHFSRVEVDIANPGDDARVIHIVDAVEPRCRMSPADSDFPGLLSPPTTVGSGRTHRLDGCAVVAVAQPVPGEPTYWREAIFDMAGEGARYSPFSALHNVVLTFHASERFRNAPDTADNVMGGTVEAADYVRAVRIATLKAAKTLARTTEGSSPGHMDVRDLAERRNPDLPDVVYLFQAALPFIYGEIAAAGGMTGPGHLPTVIHPNEVLDGAMVGAFGAAPTYFLQNHPIINELYERHGRDLNFNGVVLFTNGDSVSTKERISNYAANLAIILGAEGALLSCVGGGHPVVDVMLTCEKLEQRGVKTTLLMREMAANPEDSGHVHYVREADAIVSTGNYEQVVELGAAERVLGGATLLVTGESAAGRLEPTLRLIVGSTEELGSVSLRGRQY